MSVDTSSPLVWNLARAVWWLREHTLHGFAKRRFRSFASDAGIETWALFFWFLSLTAFVIVPPWSPIGWILLVVAVLRILELLINAFHVTIFYGVVDKKEIAGYRRIVILLMFNFVEIVLWFAFFFRWMPLQFYGEAVRFNIAALSYSFSTASGVGNPPLYATTDFTAILSLLESVIGIFMIVAVLARFVSFLPRPPGEHSA